MTTPFRPLFHEAKLLTFLLHYLVERREMADDGPAAESLRDRLSDDLLPSLTPEEYQDASAYSALLQYEQEKEETRR